MKKTWLTQVQDGQRYMKAWPDNSELAAILPEPRVIKATQFGIQVVPFLAVLSVTVQSYFLGVDYLPQALTFSLFLISMPVQGLYWLGKRANTPLPPSLATWYRDIHGKMCAQGHQPNVSLSRPRFIELATLLKQVYEKMDKAFTRDLF